MWRWYRDCIFGQRVLIQYGEVLLPGTQESHDLVAHGFHGQGVFSRCIHVIPNDQTNDILLLILSHLRCLSLLSIDDRGSTAQNGGSGLHEIRVCLEGKVSNKRGESRKTMENSRLEVEIEAHSICTSERSFRVVEGVNVSAKTSPANDVQCRSVEPFEDFERFGLGILSLHLLFPKLRHMKTFGPEDWHQRSDGLN